MGFIVFGPGGGRASLDRKQLSKCCVVQLTGAVSDSAATCNCMLMLTVLPPCVGAAVWSSRPASDPVPTLVFRSEPDPVVSRSDETVRVLFGLPAGAAVGSGGAGVVPRSSSALLTALLLLVMALSPPRT